MLFAAINRGEQVLWHHQYVKSAAELCQWEAVAEYARQSDNCALQMDALWRLPDWDRLKRDVLPRAQVWVLFQQILATVRFFPAAGSKRTIRLC